MTEGVATFSGLFLDRSGRNFKLRFCLYSFDRSTGNWNETDVRLDTDFFHTGEGLPASLHLEQVGCFDTTEHSLIGAVLYHAGAQVFAGDVTFSYNIRRNLPNLQP